MTVLGEVLHTTRKAARRVRRSFVGKQVEGGLRDAVTDLQRAPKVGATLFVATLATAIVNRATDHRKTRDILYEAIGAMAFEELGEIHRDGPKAAEEPKAS